MSATRRVPAVPKRAAKARRTINERRESLGWTIAELARQAQVSDYRARQACTGSAKADTSARIEAALAEAERPVHVTYTGNHPTLRDLSLHALGKRHKHGHMTVEHLPG